MKRKQESLFDDAGALDGFSQEEQEQQQEEEERGDGERPAKDQQEDVADSQGTLQPVGLGLGSRPTLPPRRRPKAPVVIDNSDESTNSLDANAANEEALAAEFFKMLGIEENQDGEGDGSSSSKLDQITQTLKVHIVYGYPKVNTSLRVSFFF